MAKQGFHGFKEKKSGYWKAMNSAAVQSRVAQLAESAAGGANAETIAHGHESIRHFETEQIQGDHVRGYGVHPTTYEGLEHGKVIFPRDYPSKKKG